MPLPRRSSEELRSLAGIPNILGTVCGAFLLQLIIMMANMNNIPYASSLMIKAGIILVALVFHNLWHR